jgi:hypothetical protein
MMRSVDIWIGIMMPIQISTERTWSHLPALRRPAATLTSVVSR